MTLRGGTAVRLGGRLLVVRDRAHARQHGDHGRGAPPRGSAVWTLGELFDRLATWGLLGGDATAPALLRDNDAALFACAGALAARGPQAPRMAGDARALQAALAHGRTSAAEVREALQRRGNDAELGMELSWLLAQLDAADRRAQESGVVDQAGALACALARLARGEQPASIARFSDVEVHGLVDPTDLEIRTLLALARAGIALRVVLPIDSGDRGLLVAVNAVLSTFEAAHDVATLDVTLDDVMEPLKADAATAPFLRAWYASDGANVVGSTPVEVAIAADENAEAEDVARVVAAWKRQRADASIAVALRSVSDDRAASRFADALARHGMIARVRRRPLADTAPARLVLDWLSLRLHGAPRERLLAVLASPARRGALSAEDAARVHRALRLAAARTDVEDAAHPSGGYRHRLERFQSSTDDDAQREAARVALAAVEPVLARAWALPLSATLVVHVEHFAALARDVIDADAHPSGRTVLEVLERARDAARRVARPDDAETALAAAVKIVEGMLRAAQASDPNTEVDEHAPEILSLPELWGRRFDHVVVAGCIEGRLPRAERAERLLSDQDRATINGALGRPALRLFDDDPLEAAPVPRTQALEPVWMLGALRAGTRSLLLTAARRDARGRETAASVFLLEALRALGAGPHDLRAGCRFARAPSRRDGAILAARLRAAGQLPEERAVAAGVDGALLERIDLVRRMRDERARFFAELPDKPALARRAPFAFAVDAERMATFFGGSFGLSPERPLTPTRLEALAGCRLHGFVQHVLKVDVDRPAGNAADARVIGTLAHTVMERFFRERRAAQVPATRMSALDRRRVRTLLAEEAAPLLAGRATGHLGAIRAQIGWLETALVRAVSMLARTPPVPSVEPSGFEVQIGVDTRERKADQGAVPLDIGGRTVWLGGIIDRVDQGPGGRAVIDYKTSKTSTIKAKVHADALFATHFQLLLYLRLLEHHSPTEPSMVLHGYLISLLDGTTSADVAKVDELRARLMDDGREDGLGAGIGRVLLPILEGVLPPDPGDSCKRCRLQRLCRLPLATEGAPDGAGPDDGGGP